MGPFKNESKKTLLSKLLEILFCESGPNIVMSYVVKFLKFKSFFRAVYMQLLEP